ncbi:MAG: HepT-like ribonuclease domain-containing protein [Candidatus Hydrogenedentales bacterium]
MLDAARQVDRFVIGVTLHAYEGDRKLQLAVERLLEIIGEAARRISSDGKKDLSHIPWARIVGLRNILIHEYGEIRNDIVWRVATVWTSELIAALEALEIDKPS